MIKPNDIKTIEFDVSVLGGYKRENVDSFIESISADYEKLYKENQELVQKLKGCIEKIEEYQIKGDALQSAIIKAEQSEKEAQIKAESKINEAEEKAATIIKEAEIKAEMVIAESKKEADTIVTKSKFEAENIVSKAKIEAADAIKKCEEDAEKKIVEINSEVEFQNARLLAIKKEVSDFRNDIMERYKAHLSSLTEIPKFKAEVPSQNEAAPEKIEIVENSAEEKEEEIISEEVTDKTITVDIKSTDSTSDADDLHDSSDESTAEFVLKKKDATKIEVPQKRFEQEMLKFGTDFDVKNDK